VASPLSLPLLFIFQEAKESIDEEDPRPTSSNETYITSLVKPFAHNHSCPKELHATPNQKSTSNSKPKSFSLWLSFKRSTNPKTPTLTSMQKEAMHKFMVERETILVGCLLTLASSLFKMTLIRQSKRL